MKCPHCNNKIIVEIKRPKSRARSATFESAQAISTPVPIAPGQRSTVSETPAHLPTRESHVVVPFQQALITGALWGPVGGIGVGLGTSYFFDLKTGWAIVSGVVGFAGMIWLVMIVQWGKNTRAYNDLLWKVEEWTGLDINRDETVGNPEPQTVRIEMQEQSPQGQRWQFADLPVSRDKLRAMADNVVELGDSFSERTAKAVGMTQDEFRSLRDEFIVRGWAAWNHPTRKQQGVTLTRGGIFVLKQILA